MRFVIKARIPNEAGNRMVQDPNFIANMENYIKSNNAEAAYFLESGGDRTAVFVIDVASADKMPLVSEPLFLLGAQVEFHPAMTLEDLKKAVQHLTK